MAGPATPANGPNAAPRRLGLLAGWGRFPILVAQTLRSQGHQVHCLGIVGHAERELADACDEFEWIGLARFGAALRWFRRRGIDEAMMAGKIHKVVLFQRRAWLNILPDWYTLRACMPHFLTRKKDCKDDTLLTMVVDAFARGGVQLVSPTDLAPQLLVQEGHLTRRSPSPWQWKDIRFGWTLAKEMGRLDIGQSVAVKNQAVLAIEAVEGTDACIRRAGELCPAGGFTVVKVAKPQQDMRFDVPTVGLRTLQTLAKAGGRVLAIEAERTIFLDPDAVIDFANRHKMVIVAIRPEAV